MGVWPPLLSRCSATDFMGAARADASESSMAVDVYLTQATLKCDTYLRSSEVHDREEVRRVLLGVLQQEGQMALLMGGKSVGKSLLLRELARLPTAGKDGVPRMVVLVNGRSCGADLTAGVVLALEKATLEGSAKDRARCSAVIEGLRTAFSPEVPMALADKQLPTGLAPPGLPEAVRLLSLMVSLARREGAYLCLVIDEGNLALPTPPLPGEVPVGEGSSEEQGRQLRSTKALLNHLVQLTKELQWQWAFLHTRGGLAEAAWGLFRPFTFCATSLHRGSLWWEGRGGRGVKTCFFCFLFKFKRLRDVKHCV
jgi:hypothetical protein